MPAQLDITRRPTARQPRVTDCRTEAERCCALCCCSVRPTPCSGLGPPRRQNRPWGCLLMGNGPLFLGRPLFLAYSPDPHGLGLTDQSRPALIPHSSRRTRGERGRGSRSEVFEVLSTRIPRLPPPPSLRHTPLDDVFRHMLFWKHGSQAESRAEFHTISPLLCLRACHITDKGGLLHGIYATTLQKPDQNPHSLDAPLPLGGSVCLYTTSTWRDALQKARSRGRDAVVVLQNLGWL